MDVRLQMPRSGFQAVRGERRRIHLNVIAWN